MTIRSGGTANCAECEVERAKCADCGREIADAHDEGNHNTGECGCDESLALCWRTWNGDKCCERSPYLASEPCHAPTGGPKPEGTL